MSGQGATESYLARHPFFSGSPKQVQQRTQTSCVLQILTKCILCPGPWLLL